ncbi:MAG: amidohydrolase family protein [Anaerotardibacter sp.]
MSFLFSDITVMDEYGKEYKNAYVGVTDGVIDYFDTIPPQKTYERTYKGAGKMVMPGKYNAHAHAPMSLLRGRGENLPLDRWLNEAIFPFEAFITDKESYTASLLSIAEMLRFGVVSFSDMHYNSAARAQAVLDSGIKANIDYTLIAFDKDVPYEKMEAYKVNNYCLKEFHGANNGRLLYDASVHAEYTTHPQIVKDVSNWALENNLRVQVHVSETASEFADCKERHGLTPVAYFEKMGLFRVPCTAAHCVYLEEQDYEILARNKVFVALNPASNAKLGSGIADVEGMLKAGINVCLGTDGVASNNNLNMHEDMYLLALMQRAQKRNPVGITSGDIITIATRNGARSQGRDDCGSIKVGNKADLVVYNLNTPWMQPIENLASGFVYSAQGSDVCLTMVDGDVLYEDGEYKTIDVERLIFEVNQIRDSIVDKMAQAQ